MLGLGEQNCVVLSGLSKEDPYSSSFLFEKLPMFFLSKVLTPFFDKILEYN